MLSIQRQYHEYIQLKIEKNYLEKGIQQLHFSPGARPQAIHYMLLQAETFLPMQKKKTNKKSRNSCKEEEMLTLTSAKKENINKRACLQHFEWKTHLKRQCWVSQQAVATPLVPLFPAAGMTMHEHPLHLTAGNCSQETEVLKIRKQLPAEINGNHSDPLDPSSYQIQKDTVHICFTGPPGRFNSSYLPSLHY